MRNAVYTIPATDFSIPRRVAAYCRVSTDSGEQQMSLDAQVQYYSSFIDSIPSWENAGIFAEHASGLRIAERTEFLRMMRLCRKKKIDLILTKSVSRFGRNTLDMLRALQELNTLGIDVYFEVERLFLHERQMQFLLTTYCALAQGESQSKSNDIKWGVKQGFRSGTSGYADFVCFGYKAGDNSALAIDEPAAEVVRQVFEMRAEGASLGTISDWLYENRIASPTGKEHWSRETISKLLKNEKYIGDVLLQKTFVKDLFSGKQKRNNGELERFLIQEHHPAIVSKELFEQVKGKPVYEREEG